MRLSSVPVPAEVRAARERAAARGFEASSGDVLGAILATLAAAVPPGGRILEIGTGCGAGTAWLTAGLTGRTDVRVVTLEADTDLAQETAAHVADVVDVLPEAVEDCWETIGTFDLVFADAEGGKWTQFRRTRDLVRPGGVLVLDDLDELRYTEDDHRRTVVAIVDEIRHDARFVETTIPVETGLLVAVRRYDSPGAA
ncbi:O-methyltransferase [Cellulosimicrobium marinum]|uniref:O-methyltransferase n=1 Tax=Cellulosimicrobium marinum TaxID=1638992 RepID=UPI001E658063|nr:class I SAM-dependent methyltransferase [Cellulosimicrobium marinum]MCB7135716.1 class I SAM-dependent methyltransferase [Cellulosimicrobium marinum]